MNLLPASLAKNAKWLLAAVTLLAGLVFMVTGPLAGPTTPKPSFTLAISGTQTATRGGSPVSYTVTISRTGGFNGPVALNIQGLPKGVSPSWQPNGQGTYTAPATNSPTQTVQLNMTATAASDTGNKNFHVKGTGCKSGGSCTDLSDDVEGKMTIVESTTPNFGLSVDKNPLNVKPGKKQDLQVKFDGLAGFNGPVTLSIGGLPSATTGSFDINPLDSKHDHAKLTIQTSNSTAPGTYTVTVTGTSATLGTRSVSFALVVEGVTGVANFAISGNVPSPLNLGSSRDINLSLANSNSFTVYISDLTVSVAGTSSSGCGTSNFSITQIPSSAYPIAVGAGQTATLDQLGVQKPTITWVNLPQPQNACIGVTVNLSYAGNGADTP